MKKRTLLLIALATDIVLMVLLKHEISTWCLVCNIVVVVSAVIFSIAIITGKGIRLADQDNSTMEKSFTQDESLWEADM